MISPPTAIKKLYWQHDETVYEWSPIALLVDAAIHEAVRLAEPLHQRTSVHVTNNSDIDYYRWSITIDASMNLHHWVSIREQYEGTVCHAARANANKFDSCALVLADPDIQDRITRMITRVCFAYECDHG